MDFLRVGNSFTCVFQQGTLTAPFTCLLTFLKKIYHPCALHLLGYP